MQCSAVQGRAWMGEGGGRGRGRGERVIREADGTTAAA